MIIFNDKSFLRNIAIVQIIYWISCFAFALKECSHGGILMILTTLLKELNVVACRRGYELLCLVKVGDSELWVRVIPLRIEAELKQNNKKIMQWYANGLRELKYFLKLSSHPLENESELWVWIRGKKQSPKVF